MTIQEIQQILREKLDDRGLEAILMEEWPTYENKLVVPRNEIDALTHEDYVIMEDHLGFYIDLVDSYSSGSAYSWVFQVDDKFYKTDGYWSSWSGTDFEDPYNFYEVVEAERTIKYWKRA